jgi:hypothetical protein
MYDPPPRGYARTVCRYDVTTIASRSAIAPPIGSIALSAAAPGQREDEHHLLGGVRDRGERVRRQDRKREQLGEQLVLLFVRRQSAAQQQSFDHAARCRGSLDRRHRAGF